MSFRVYIVGFSVEILGATGGGGILLEEVRPNRNLLKLVGGHVCKGKMVSGRYGWSEKVTFRALIYDATLLKAFCPLRGQTSLIHL